MTEAVEMDVEQASTDLANDILGDLPGGEPLTPEAPAELEIPIADPKENEKSSEAGRERGEDGRFKPKAPSKPSAPSTNAAPATPAAPAPVESISVPQSWKKEMHPFWEKTPREVQQYYLDREAEMRKGVEGYKGDAEFGRSIREVSTRHQDLLEQQGLQAPQAFDYLMNAHRQLSVGTPEAKQAYLRKVAETYGIDFPTVDPNAPQPAPLDPAVQARIDALEQAFHAEANQRYQARQTEVGKQIDAFATDPKNKHFEACADHIVAFLKSDPNLQLGDAYDKAVWANPVTRQLEIAALQTQWETDFRKKAVAAAQTARKAVSTNVRGRDTTRSPQGPSATVDNMDEALRETYQEIQARH